MTKPKKPTRRLPAPTATTYTITVTEEDIARAHKNDSYHCVVTQAIARHIPDATRIEVDTQSIRFTRPELGRVNYFTPYSVQGYVIAFDAGDEIGPFRFQLNRPVRIEQKKLTETGKTVMKARNDAVAAQKQASKQAAKKVDPPKPARSKTRALPKSKPGEPAASADPLVPLTGAYAYAKARQEHPGPMKEKVPGDADRSRGAPRVFKSKTREYGSRMLRINKKPTS